MTDYNIFCSGLVLVDCLAKQKRTINRRVQKRLDMEQLHHLGTGLVTEHRETGKVVQKRCLFMRRSRSVQLDSRSVLSCDKVGHSCDKIER